MEKHFLSGLFLLFIISISAQTKVTVYPVDSYVKENLDLDAVSKIYEEAANLQDFETRLNNPGYRISNLDLNNDEKVDYLRVSQKMEGNTIKIIIESEIEPYIYQEVASMNLLIQPKKKRSNPEAAIPIISSVLDIIYKIIIIKNEL
jgi:hypothetical protein